MEKTFLIILSLQFFIAPVFASAQTPPPVFPDIIDVGQIIIESIPAPISNFIDKLRGINIGGQSTVSGGGSMDFSSVKEGWDSINNWFSSNIGVSFTEIVKSVANLVIWIWEIIIKLIKVGISYL